MAAHHLIQLTCDKDRCKQTYPVGAPAEGITVGDLRDQAATVGWEVMRGKHGRDVCPTSRIAEIQAAQANGGNRIAEFDGGDTVKGKK